MNKQSEWKEYGCLILIATIILTCFWINLPGIVINAVNAELNHPPPPVPIEQQTVSNALPDLNGDTAARMTGYELEFPPGTIDWRVTYSAHPSSDYAGADSRYTIIEPTYWCKVDEGNWFSCQPVIRKVKG